MLLAVAGFASQAMVRSADSLLPQIAGDFGVTVGAASIVVSAYTVVHGLMQLVSGPVGDRVGKYRMIAIATALCALLVFACGLASSLPLLLAARIASGMGAAWIIPLGMAYIGDVVPYGRRQQVLGRYMSGQIIGQLFGQAAGGVIGDAFGWRTVFFVLAGLFAVAALGLARELKVNPLTRETAHSAATFASVVATTGGFSSRPGCGSCCWRRFSKALSCSALSPMWAPTCMFDSTSASPWSASSSARSESAG